MRTWKSVFLAVALAGLLLAPSSWAEQVKVDVRDGERLTQTLQKEMLRFVQQNYPGHLPRIIRSLQSRESQMHRDLVDSVQLMRGFARGPVTFEGAFRQVGGATRYVLLGTIHGVEGYPNATVRFETYPGILRPFTDVQVDQDGDGRVDERSQGICQWRGMWDWLQACLPLKTRLARAQQNFAPQRLNAEAAPGIGS